MNFVISYALFMVSRLGPCLEICLYILLNIVLERFEEEMKFDVMPTGTSVYRELSLGEKEKENKYHKRQIKANTLPLWLLSGTLRNNVYLLF